MRGSLEQPEEIVNAINFINYFVRQNYIFQDLFISDLILMLILI